MSGDNPQIFVTKLPPGTNNDKLRSIFKKYGEIVQANMKGTYGFVVSLVLIRLLQANVRSSKALGTPSGRSTKCTRPKWKVTALWWRKPVCRSNEEGREKMISVILVDKEDIGLAIASPIEGKEA